MKKTLFATVFIAARIICSAQNIMQKNENHISLCESNIALSSQYYFHEKNHGIDWKNKWEQHSTRKIIIGSIFIVLGAEGITESIISTVNSNTPSYNLTDEIGKANLSAFILTSGTVLLTRGIHLKRQNKLKLSTSKNGIGFIYTM